MFRVVGWRLLVSGMRALADAPAVLSAAERASLQQRVGARLLQHLRAEVQIEGLSNLPRSPHVVVALHEGIADVLCLSLLGLPCRIVAREEIFGWPWIGPALARMRHIAIEPEQGAASYRRLLAAARETMSAGEHVVLFPQGAVLGIETAFQPGAFRLARRLGAPILPIVLSGSHRIWEHPFSPCLRYGQHAAAVVLPPLSAAEVAAGGLDELRVELQRRMKSVALSDRLPAPRRYVPQRDGFWDDFVFEIDPAFPEVRDAVAKHRRMRRGS